MKSFVTIRLLRHYAGKFRTLRDDVRTAHLLNSLPSGIRKDIGWPDLHAERRAHRD